MRFPFFFSLLSLLGACAAQQTPSGEGPPPSHREWDQLLGSYVDALGRVDYAGLQKDTARLNGYLQLLSSHAPANDWSREERLAYWINAYNAFTVKLIVDAYPLQSIKELNPSLSIPLLRTVWTQKFFQIGGKSMSLDDIEHKILRKEFDEPRIHFAINCASASCPPLRNEAYTEEKLEQQLEAQARRFLLDPAYNLLTPEKVELSRIFSWFKGDFTRQGNLIDFLNRYAKEPILPGAEMRFREYDWSLNGQ